MAPEVDELGPGSSPHTRGAPPGGTRTPAQARIIPAYAGSTLRRRRRRVGPRDHPRIRGEHKRGLFVTFNDNGSSPHTRGAHLRLRLATRQLRIIPAYAGSTLAYLKSSRKGTDHPRIRGEHHLHDARAFVIAGSSPHTRGAHYSIAVYHRRLGIIPAYAGSTSTSRTSFRTAQDHPRIRGEHLTPT